MKMNDNICQLPYIDQISKYCISHKQWVTRNCVHCLKEELF